jgi:hypothetical protein
VMWGDLRYCGERIASFSEIKTRGYKIIPPFPFRSSQSADGKARMNVRTDRRGKEDMPKSSLVRRKQLRALGWTELKSVRSN